MAQKVYHYSSSDDESITSNVSEDIDSVEEEQNTKENIKKNEKKSLNEELKKEQEKFGYFDATIPKEEFHYWHLGQKKLNLQEIYHTKYLYDDRTEVQFGENRENSCILVRPIPKGFYEQEMYDFFSQVAPIRRMRIKRDPKNGAIIKNFSYAYVDFKDPESAAIICEEIPMLYIRGEMVTIKKCSARPERIEKFFNELKPEEYAAQILKDSSVKGESYSIRRRKIIPSLVFAKNRATPLYLKYMREKKQEEREEKLKETLEKYGLSYKYEDIQAVDVPSSDKKRKREETPAKRKKSKGEQ